MHQPPPRIALAGRVRLAEVTAARITRPRVSVGDPNLRVKRPDSKHLESREGNSALETIYPVIETLERVWKSSESRARDDIEILSRYFLTERTSDDLAMVFQIFKNESLENFSKVENVWEFLKILRRCRDALRSTKREFVEYFLRCLRTKFWRIF